MGRSTSRKSARRREIDAAAKAAFLASLRAGICVAGSAEAAGFTADGFYSLRRRDPSFRLSWEMARELGAGVVASQRRAAAGAGKAAGGEGETRFTPCNLRRVQERKLAYVKFTAERRGIFLASFAATADATHAAAEAGVAVTTVYKTRRNDPDFAALFDAALAEAYVRLEAEAVRQRLAAQEAMKAAPEPSIQMAGEFDRVMALLRRWDRGGGKTGVREISRERMKSASFDEAMAVLAKRLKALGYRPAPPPPEQA
jgi:hypothetical protein